MRGLFIILAGLLAVTFAANYRTLCEGWAPRNHLWLSEYITVSGISESSYNRAMDRVQAQYEDDFKALGKTFVIKRSWSSGTVNAQAWQEGSTWYIEMFGGLARYQGMTTDAFTLVACHEIGHHLGGAPKYTGNSWASVEGQSDYFATLKCAKRVISGSDQEENERALAEVDPEIQEQCALNALPEDQISCMRFNQAATVLAGVLADLNGQPKPKLTTPDPHVVTRTNSAHPAAQCRLDTMYQASLCGASGDLSNTDPAPGTCYAIEAIKGGRPFCWFKP